MALNSNTNLLISRHLALITHDATMSMNSSILTKIVNEAIKLNIIFIRGMICHCCLVNYISFYV